MLAVVRRRMPVSHRAVPRVLLPRHTRTRTRTRTATAGGGGGGGGAAAAAVVSGTGSRRIKQNLELLPGGSLNPVLQPCRDHGVGATVGGVARRSLEGTPRRGRR